jgi:hypothetical protein
MKSKLASYLSRYLVFSLLLLSSLVLSGCLPIRQFSVQPMPGNRMAAAAGPPARFDGLQTELAVAAANHCTLRVLIVHGMGIQAPGYSTGLVNRVAAKMKLRFMGESPTNTHPGEDGSVLTVRHFENGPAKLCVYELTWSPITLPIKASQFDRDSQTPLVMSRQMINHYFKTNLVDDALSDVVLYIGQFRPKLRQPIINAITQINQDSGRNNDPIAIITHSLGSYMVTDTLNTMDDQTAAKKYAAHVNQIFMLANQLPMLELSDRANFRSEPAGVMTGFSQLREAGRQQHMRNEPRRELEIVAFSDPNDLLSYELRKHDLEDGTTNGASIKGFNVRYTDEHWSILGVVSSPGNAHVNWWTDSRVPGFLADGLDANSSYEH